MTENQKYWKTRPCTSRKRNQPRFPAVTSVLHKYRQMAAAVCLRRTRLQVWPLRRISCGTPPSRKAAEEGETAPRTSAQQTYEEDMVEYRAAQNKRDTDVQSYNQQLSDNERSQQTVQYNIDNAEEYMEKSVLNNIRFLTCLQRQSGSVRHHRL